MSAFKKSLKSPLPQRSLGAEAERASKIIEEFRHIRQDAKDLKEGTKVDHSHIPTSVLANAKGIAVISMIKGGFLVSGSGGSGVVVARLPDGRWSAPCAIGLLSAGGGFLVGLQSVDFILVMNRQNAVDSFKSRGSLKVGADCSLAIGPVGREAQGLVGVDRQLPAIYYYGKSLGLYGGIELDASGFISRKKANQRFYGREVTPFELLDGRIEPPAVANPLYRALDRAIKPPTSVYVPTNHRNAPPPPQHQQQQAHGYASAPSINGPAPAYYNQQQQPPPPMSASADANYRHAAPQGYAPPPQGYAPQGYAPQGYQRQPPYQQQQHPLSQSHDYEQPKQQAPTQLQQAGNVVTCQSCGSTRESPTQRFCGPCGRPFDF
jgi:lipid-binding SYLF domain-containing protein